MLLRSDFVNGMNDRRVQLVKVLRTKIGKIPRLEIRPRELVRVKLRSIRRQELQMDSPTTLQPMTKRLAFVCPQPIPDNDQPSLQMTQQVPQEFDDLLLANPQIQVESQIPTQVSPPRRDREPTDRGDAPPTTHSRMENWSTAAQRPCPANQRMQQKTRFINKHEVGMTPGRQTLDPGPVVFNPIPNGSFVAFLGLGLGLLRGKNPTPTSGVEWRRRGRTGRTVGRSTVQSCDRSIGRCQSHNGSHPSANNAPILDVAALRASVAGQEMAWRQAPRDHPVAKPKANVEHFDGRRLAFVRSGLASYPAATASRPCAAVAPNRRHFHVVS